MPRAEKVQRVSELTERINGSQALFVTDYRGLSVAEATELRRSLRGSGTRFTVTKNTLLKRAVGEVGIEGFEGILEGPTAIAFVDGDPIAAAKSLADAMRRYRTLEIRGGFMEGRVLTAAEAAALATIEPREVLLSKLAGALKAETSRAAAMLQALQSRFLAVLGAYREKLPTGAEPVAGPGADEPGGSEEPVEGEAGPAAEAAVRDDGGEPNESEAAAAQTSEEPQEATASDEDGKE